jgi:hypothetical protein
MSALADAVLRVGLLSALAAAVVGLVVMRDRGPGPGAAPQDDAPVEKP